MWLSWDNRFHLFPLPIVELTADLDKLTSKGPLENVLHLVNDIHVVQLALEHCASYGLWCHRIRLLLGHHLVHFIRNRERLALGFHGHVLLELLLLSLNLLILKLLLLGELLVHIYLVELLLHLHKLIRMETRVLLLVLHHELVEVVILLLRAHSLHGLNTRKKCLQ